MPSAAEPGVLVLPFRKGGAAGYDLAVTAADATVEDYLGALDEAARHLFLTRTRNPGGRCAGCSACCAERIPLTSIDFRRLTGRRDISARLLSELTDIGTLGAAVDIVLKRETGGRCLFLDPDRGLCRVWRARPLVCRSFICCPVSSRASDLRGAVTNAGEDELVRLSLGALSLPGVDPADWTPGPFTGRWSYQEVRLRDCVTPALWRRLYQKGTAKS